MPGSAARTATADVVCLGESMVTFLPSQPGRLADVPSFGRGIGGAESNVACALAAAGHRAKWVGRVGADGFGDHLVDTIALLRRRHLRRPPRPRPPHRHLLPHRDGPGHRHPRGGVLPGLPAASAMSPENVPYEDLLDTRVLHLSGITAALSADCLALLRDLTAPREDRPLISFDVNHRPGLWRDGEAYPEVLLDLARRSDLVFVGEDEAEEAWGVHGTEAIRAALPEPGVLVVKRGSDGVTVFSRTGRTGSGTAADTVTTVPSLHVDVVAAVGAGDAFAAGFLSATLRDLPVRDRARHGHLMAAAVLTVPGDLTGPPPRDHADRLAALDDEAWGTLRLGPGWTVTAGANEEVRVT